MKYSFQKHFWLKFGKNSFTSLCSLKSATVVHARFSVSYRSIKCTYSLKEKLYSMEVNTYWIRYKTSIFTCILYHIQSQQVKLTMHIYVLTKPSPSKGEKFWLPDIHRGNKGVLFTCIKGESIRKKLQNSINRTRSPYVSKDMLHSLLSGDF